MPLPRSQQICLEQTAFYHVVSRCVRRHFLCGQDKLTGRDFSHRREAIRSRLFELAEIFAIDVCAYAIMSNHYHVVLRVDEQRALVWSDEEVAERWLRLYSGPALLQSYSAGQSLTDTQLHVVENFVAKYRRRLFDISWFMKCLNEPIAREANQEDGVTGHFWEGRFKSQALLDEAALLSAMSYVDLNPIRADMAKTPEASDFTSIQQRIGEWQAGRSGNASGERRQPADLAASIHELLPFSDEGTGHPAGHPDPSIPFSLADYLELVDWTGRAVVEGKRGSIPEGLPPILERLKIDRRQYLKFVGNGQTGFHVVIGTGERMREFATAAKRSFVKGQAAAAALFSPG